MRHPEPDVLELDFNVPTPTPAQLLRSRRIWWTLTAAYFAAYFLLAVLVWPRVDVSTFIMLIPGVTVWALRNRRPRVQKVTVNSTQRTLHVTELRAGKSVTRLIPFLEIDGIRYQPSIRSGITVTPAMIWIDAVSPYESVSLTELGLSQQDELVDWLHRMIKLEEGAARLTKVPHRPDGTRAPLRIDPQQEEQLLAEISSFDVPARKPVWLVTFGVLEAFMLITGAVTLIFWSWPFGLFMIAAGIILNRLLSRIE